MNEAAKYYALTEGPYLQLCPDRSGYMNMGSWPALSLEDAQKKLIRELVSFRGSRNPKSPSLIVDAGSGWGAARKMFFELFPECKYIGINNSARQIAHARRVNSEIPFTEYKCMDIEEFCPEIFDGGSVLVAVEAAFHFECKEGVIAKMSHAGIEEVMLAEICSSRSLDVSADPLLKAPLRHCWTVDKYEEELRRNGYSEFSLVDVSNRTFEGFLNYLMTLDPQSMGSSRRLVRQFQKAFARMMELAVAGQLRYVFIVAAKPIGAPFY